MSDTCRDCPAPVFWARTPKGKWMLVNEQPVDGGNLEIDFDVRPPAIAVVKPEPGVSRHVSHFSNCPGATKRRKR